MKVLAINGSPKAKGNTFHALNTVCSSLLEEGIDSEIIHVGNKKISGCMACHKCFETGRCIFNDELFDEWMEKMYAADGIILGTPVYYSGINGTMKSFLDRAFFQKQRNFRHKLGASVAVLRRSGGVATFDQLNHYFTISEMPIVSSQYWNVIHGHTEGEVLMDYEALAALKALGKNMAWLLKMIEATQNTIEKPKEQEIIRTNFIR
ncbi:MAG: flavodoxin family protein [Lachnospiraceae bacterium]|nr:flavodoxin family protein [Lachnospiraceae bacterium]